MPQGVGPGNRARLYCPLDCSLFVLYYFTMINALPNQPYKGRGAVSNRTGRFEAQERVAVHDGWDVPAHIDDTLPKSPRTVLGVDAAKRIISRNKSPDVPFDRSINPYRGCEHGCIYCFARPTHAYYGLSPGLDFETKLFHKPNAPELLAEELRKLGYVPATMALGTNTDPYQPIERTEKLTRRILEVLAAFKHPFSIVTKSPLVTRDLDIIQPMAEQGLAQVSISVTTLDRVIARKMEPRAPAPLKRIEAIRALSMAGVPTSVLAAPMIPALNDNELESILEAAHEAGASGAHYILLRLPLEIRDLFIEWLHENFPDRANHVMSLVRDTRAGADYRSDFGARMSGTGPYATLLKRRFDIAQKRLGLKNRWRDLTCDKFAPPPRSGDQLALF
jgi:DNA repair photolyase